MIGLLRWGSRLVVLAALLICLYAVLLAAGPPEWMKRKEISFTRSIASSIAADPTAFQRLNEGETLAQVFPEQAEDIQTTGLSYSGGILVFSNGFESFYYYDVQGACWLFDMRRLTTLDQCPR